MKIIREGKERVLSITLGEFKDKAAVNKADFDNVLKDVVVQDLTQSLRDRLRLPENVIGVVIAAVNADSPARGRLQTNDVIQEVGKEPVQSVQDYDRAVSKIGEKEAVLLLIYRDGGSLYITIKP